MEITELQIVFAQTLKVYGVEEDEAIFLTMGLLNDEDEMLYVLQWIVDNDPTADEIVDKCVEIIQALNAEDPEEAN